MQRQRNYNHHNANTGWSTYMWLARKREAQINQENPKSVSMVGKSFSCSLFYFICFFFLSWASLFFSAQNQALFGRGILWTRHWRWNLFPGVWTRELRPVSLVGRNVFQPIWIDMGFETLKGPSFTTCVCLPKDPRAQEAKRVRVLCTR